MNDITQMKVADIAAMEKEHLLQWLPKLAHMAKLIDAIKSRAKAHLDRDPDFFDGEWILKEGATKETVIDSVGACQILLALKKFDQSNAILPQELLAIAGFSVVDLRKLYGSAMELPPDVAKDKLPEILGDTLKVGKNSPSLKRGD